MIIEKLICSNCGEEFLDKYYEYGSIHHDNYTNDHNMKVEIYRLENKIYSFNDFFLESITLQGNHCNIKNNTYRTAYKIFKCRLIWLKKNGYEDIYNKLSKKEKDIKKEFAKVMDMEIKEHKKEINKLKLYKDKI